MKTDKALTRVLLIFSIFSSITWFFFLIRFVNTHPYSIYLYTCVRVVYMRHMRAYQRDDRKSPYYKTIIYYL